MRGRRKTKRDERGWSVPKKGTKSWEVYQFLINDYTNQEIYDAMSHNERQERRALASLIFYIKNPDKKNANNANWIKNNPERFKAIAKKSKKKLNDSAYVLKLVRHLKIPIGEARERERKELKRED